MVSPLNQRLIEAFGRRPQIDIFGEDELDLPETQGSLRDVLSPTPSGTLLGQFAGPPTGLEAATGGITAPLGGSPQAAAPLGGPFQQPAPVGAAPAQPEGGFLDRFLGAARPGSVGAGLREGFFGGNRARRAVQLEKAQLEGTRALNEQRRAAAEASARAAQSPLGKLRRDFDQGIISATTFDAARTKAVDIPPEELVLLQNPENPNDVRTFREGNTQVDELIGQGFENVGKRQRIETAEAGGFTETQAGKRLVDFENLKVSTTQSLALTSRIKEQLSKSGASVLGAVGGAQRLFGEVGAQIQGAAEAFDVSLNPTDFDFSAFEGGAVKSAQIRSNITKLSFLVALARNPGGRITERDVQAALNEIGASPDPKQFFATISEVEEGLKRDFSIRSDIGFGRPNAFAEDIAPVLERQGITQTGAPAVLTPGPGGIPTLDLRSR